MDFIRTLKKRRPKQHVPTRVTAAPHLGSRRYVQRRIEDYLHQSVSQKKLRTGLSE